MIPTRLKYISIILKSIVALSSTAGVLMSVFQDGPAAPDWNCFLFFTIQSNIWIAAVCLAGIVMMANGRKPGRAWSTVKLVFTISITLTGMVYCFMLAPTLEGNAFTPDSVLVHVCAPLAAVADFLVCGKEYDLRYKDALWVALPPLYYLFFASAGYLCGWNFTAGQNYPYFFLNWGSPLGAFGFSGEFPFMGVMWYVAALLSALWLFGLLYVGMARLERKNRWTTGK